MTDNSAQDITQESAENLIRQAHKLQLNRNSCFNKMYNQDLEFADFKEQNLLNSKAWQVLSLASEKQNLALRTVTNILRVAQTIADISQKSEIDADCIFEALQYQELSNKLATSGFTL